MNKLILSDWYNLFIFNNNKDNNNTNNNYTTTTTTTISNTNTNNDDNLIFNIKHILYYKKEWNNKLE